MTTRFRIDTVTVDTTDGEVTYQFPSALTVLAGPVGVGKSTLFELIKYGLGGNGELAQVAVTAVREIQLRVTVGNERFGLTRSLDSKKSKVVRVTDLITHERLPDQRTGDGEPSLSALLLNALGLPADLRAAARTRTTTNAGARISFADVFTFMYVRQADINRDIASSKESYREPKRKSVFELLFGLTDAEILRLRSELATRNGERDQANHDHSLVVQFLRDSGTTSRITAENAVQTATRDEATALAEMDALRNAVDPVVDRETLTLRDLLSEAERSLAAARDTATRLAQQQAEYTSERRRVVLDLDRLRRLQDAGDRLASIEFAVCPRCLQDLTHRETPHDQCRLCLQPDPLAVGTAPTSEPSYEQRQLHDQLAEMDELILTVADQLTDTHASIVNRHELIAKLSDDLDARTRNRITPQLQAFSDATRRLTQARAQLHELEGVLRQWDRVDDLGAEADRLQGEVNRLQTAVTNAENQLAQHKSDLMDELDAEFAATVAAIGIPGVETAQIHRTNYLPLLNGQSYIKLSPAGGVRTTTQIAYWITLITVALRRRDTLYPAFLLIDSPRTSLNNADNLAAALYRRLITLADAASDRLQIIIGDNELPAAYRRDYDQLDFTYDHPTIATIPHPGPNAVQTLNPPPSDDQSSS
ncbi:hypothetical protein [Actinophytocola sediminis]